MPNPQELPSHAHVFISPSFSAASTRTSQSTPTNTLTTLALVETTTITPQTNGEAALATEPSIQVAAMEYDLIGAWQSLGITSALCFIRNLFISMLLAPFLLMGEMVWNINDIIDTIEGIADTLDGFLDTIHTHIVANIRQFCSMAVVNLFTSALIMATLYPTAAIAYVLRLCALTVWVPAVLAHATANAVSSLTLTVLEYTEYPLHILHYGVARLVWLPDLNPNDDAITKIFRAIWAEPCKEVHHAGGQVGGQAEFQGSGLPSLLANERPLQSWSTAAPANGKGNGGLYGPAPAVHLPN
ncbi:hypothetical protein VTI74DRAFT_2092 [Chaetomium olivicolor]